MKTVRQTEAPTRNLYKKSIVVIFHGRIGDDMGNGN